VNAPPRHRRLRWGAESVILILVIAVVLYVSWGWLLPIAGEVVNIYRTSSAPAGTLIIDRNPAAPRVVTAGPMLQGPATGNDWPSYNKTLTSERFSSLAEINTHNASSLKIICSYDIGEHTAFQSGLLMVDGAIIGTTEHDTFSIDSATCQPKWRQVEKYKGASPLTANRGAAYLNGSLYRGTEDGRVLAYDLATGKRLWETQVADPAKGETTPSAPIAWNGLVFIGNAGGDIKGIKGRMYALDAATGRIVWEFYLVPKEPDDVVRGPQGSSPLTRASWGENSPINGGGSWTSYSLDPERGLLYIPVGNPAPDFAEKMRPGQNLFTDSVVVLDAKTGAYQTHVQIVSPDWHDFDVSSAPALVTTRSGRHLMSLAPKDGYLYGYDLDAHQMLYRLSVDRHENADVPLTVGKELRVCPGTQGGAEWNGPAYDPPTNLMLIGQTDYCSSLKLANDATVRAIKPGKVFGGNDMWNPYDLFGKFDALPNWGGWVYAADADTGNWIWRAKSNYPVISGLTTTAGGVAMFGDAGGNFYVIDTASGEKLWGRKIGGAIGGGVITFAIDGGSQRVAVATGMTSIVWPTKQTNATIVVLGL
jgi:alcohol dehydrogenase (cytochrome c)